MGKKLYAGLDVGGTSMMAVVANSKGKILGEAEAKTLHGGAPEDVIAQIVGIIEKAAKEAGTRPRKLGGIGIGMPGAVNAKKGIVVTAPNLGWTNVGLGPILEEGLGVKVVLGNDVQVAIQGEHAFGAAKGTRRAVGIWVGTGVGGGLIEGGELDRGHRGAAGELGHICLDENGPLCPCGRKGCAEAFSSRTSMERDVKAAIASGRTSRVPDIMKERKKERMTSSVIQRALDAGDEVMIDVVARAQHYLGLLAGNIVNFYDPEMIVFGGGIVGRLGEDFVAPIREMALTRYLRPDPDVRVRIVPSKLGDHSGALGASVLAARGR
jgi:glucokinase